MKIYNPNGSLILDLDVDDNSYRNRRIMEIDSVTLRYSLAEHVELPVGAYIIFENVRYTLMLPENFKKKHSRNYDYTVLFHSDTARANQWKFRNTVDGRLKFSLTAKPREHLQMLVDNLNRRETGWSVGDCIEGTEVVITYNHAFCLDALKQMASATETEFCFEGKRVSLRKIEYYKSNPLPLSYGKGNGFKSGVGRSTQGDRPPVEIVFAEGGTENLDPSKYGNRELLLPKSQTIGFDGEHFSDEAGYNAAQGRIYVSDADGLSVRRNDKALSSHSEDSVDCTSICPKRVGTVSSVVMVDSENNLYDIVDNTIPHNLNFGDCLIEGETMTVIFQSGMLAGDGKEFEVKYYHEARNDKDGKGTKAARRFEIVPQEIDGVTMPNETFKPVAGDTYAVFHCMLPDAYICDNASKSGASWDMFRKVVRWLFDNEESKFAFTGTLDGIWAKKDWTNIGGRIRLGGYVLFSDKDFQPDGVLVRIIGVKDYINNPHSPELDLSNSTVSAGFSNTLRELKSEEVVTEEKYKQSVSFTKRRFRDAQETIGMLEKAMLENFTQSISPITVQTMSLLVGDESLQFRFIASLNSNTTVADSVVYNQADKQLTIGRSYIQHMTLGISNISSSHKPSEYKRWSVAPYTSAILTNGSAKYYLYAKVSKTDQTGTFLLSETAIKLEGVTGYYHLLVGILNSEYDGERSFASLYGFTEVLPGRITTDKIASGNGLSFFDMLNNSMKLGDKLRYNIDGDGLLKFFGVLVQSQSGVESPLGCYRGVYNASSTYYKGDEVIYAIGGLYSLYRHINNASCHNIPPTDTAYWEPQASAGNNGDWYKFLYRHSVTKPAKPSGNAPAGWSDTPDMETLSFSHSGTFSYKDGYYVSPSTADNELKKNRISFTTTKPNQVVAIEIIANSESNYDFGIVGLLDNTAMTRTGNFTDRVSGSNVSKTVYINVPTAGSHFVEIGYAKDSSNSVGADNVKYRIVKVENCWVSTARISGATQEAGAWSDPVPFSMDNNDTERIYILSKTETTPSIPTSDPYVDDFVPPLTTNDYNAANSYAVGTLVRYSGRFYKATKASDSTNPHTPTDTAYWEAVKGWTDNPSEVTFDYPIQYESIRKKTDGKWGTFNTPTVWMRYAYNGDYFEVRYATNGSTTVSPFLTNEMKAQRNPSGWTVNQPSVGAQEYLWRITAKISGETDKLLSNWSNPVRITPYDGKDGEDGKDGKSPVMVYRGAYNASKTYYGNNNRLDAVKYGDAWYIARIDAPDGTTGFSGHVPTDTNYWNSFGASFESIATNLLLAEGANIGDWFIQGGRIVSTLGDDNKITLDAVNRKIQIKSSNSQGSYVMEGENSATNIDIDAYRGIIEARSADGYSKVAYMSPTGIFANRAGTEAMSATAGRTFRAAMVALGFANVNKSEWSLDKLSTLVMGVYGRASNSGTAMAVGGFFDKLYAHGLILHRRGVSGEKQTVYLGYNDTMVVGYTSDAATVYLPADPYEGQVIFVKQWWTGYMRFKPRTGHHIYDDATENEYYDFVEGQGGMFVFSIGYVTSGSTTTKKESWLVSRWKF